MTGEPYLSAQELMFARQLREALAGFLEAPTATGVMLPDTRMILVNEALERLLGRHRDALIGRTALSFLAPEQRRHAVVELAQRAAEPSQPYSGSWRVLRPDGDELSVDVTTLIVRDRTGAVSYVVSTLRQKPPIAVEPQRAPAAVDPGLRAEVLAALPDFDSSTTSMLAVDMAGRILAANRTLASLLGYTPDELTGRDQTAVLPASGEAHDSARNAELEEMGIMPAEELTMRGKAGDSLRLRAAPILVRDGRGRPRFVLVTGRPAPRPTRASRRRGASGNRQSRHRGPSDRGSPTRP